MDVGIGATLQLLSQNVLGYRLKTAEDHQGLARFGADANLTIISALISVVVANSTITLYHHLGSTGHRTSQA